MKALVGYTGFVGSNLAASVKFDGLYNSKNVKDAFGTNPDVLYYSGVPAAKFIANKFPDMDMAIMRGAVENIRKINPKKLVLISTVDVYKDPNGKDEDSIMDTDGQEAYGKNRLWLEQQVKQICPDYHIVRLPGLYGKNIKKNFIYDFINYIPALLNEKKMEELSAQKPVLKEYYTLRDDGFWAVKTDADKATLKEIFRELGFSALNFTDSRGIFQYYNLKYLHNDIQKVIENDIRVMNIATQPIEIGMLHKVLTGNEFVNKVAAKPPYYDFKTKHCDVFGGKDGYIQTAEFVYNDIKEFVGEMI
ncbi:MAG: NAD-dependent epimerase/dehydratase family protein [Oscillospiraceae bacterium]|nr:NAD-dependent epimerase/dehydratase family protein [Oscillospiraceae bacterium]